MLKFPKGTFYIFLFYHGSRPRLSGVKRNPYLQDFYRNVQSAKLEFDPQKLINGTKTVCSTVDHLYFVKMLKSAPHVTQYTYSKLPLPESNHFAIPMNIMLVEIE